MRIFVLAAVVGISVVGLGSPLRGEEPSDEEVCVPSIPVCRLKPIRKPIKKWIYCVKRVPYCYHGCPCPCDGDGCEYRPKCECVPRYKNVLLKKEIVVAEICLFDCVLEYDPICAPPGPVEPCPDEPHTDELEAPPGPPPSAKPKLGPTARRERE